jgi:ribosomal-protein-serine acetyltransferase
MQAMAVDTALLKMPQRLELGQRLTAEPAHPSQADDLLALVIRNRAQLARYLPGAAKLVTREQVTAHFLHLEQQRHAGLLLAWALYFEDCLCGSLRLNYIDHGIGKAGVSYFLDAQLQGRGLMTRALRGLLTYAFTQLGFNRIELCHAIDNLASRRVAERTGFIYEGTLRQAERNASGLVDMCVHSVLRQEWQARGGDSTS